VDTYIYLDDEKRKRIAESLLEEDAPFQCHKTIDYAAWSRAGKFVPDSHNQMCAGAMIAMKKSGKLFYNLLVRLGVLYKKLDTDQLNMDADILAIDEFAGGGND
jgi:hypothetical protein